jgi:hypothetical protein
MMRFTNHMPVFMCLLGEGLQGFYESFKKYWGFIAQ